MTAATEREVRALAKEFRLSIDSYMSCYFNALRWTMHIFDATNELPRTYGVQFEHDHHAYLVYRDVVYNQGVTWPDAKYPDYSLRQLQRVLERI